MSLRFAILLLVLLALPQVTLAWGPTGHEVVAYIAWDNLTPIAKRKLRSLLAGQSLAGVSNWADKVRMFGRPKTAPWHYVNIPVREPVSKADMAAFCPNHDCVVDQIELAAANLKNPSATKAEKLEALKFLVHLVGDLHQPLHCADDHDRGGNDKTVRYRKSPRSMGRKLKLHEFWDHLGEINVDDTRALATKLRLTPAQRETFATAAVADWALESNVIARNIIYADFHEEAVLPDPSVAKARAIIMEQLQKAGARLAWLLNETFGR